MNFTDLNEENDDAKISEKWKLLYPEIKGHMREILEVVKKTSGAEYADYLEKDWEQNPTSEMEEEYPMWDGTKSLSGIKSIIIAFFEKDKEEFGYDHASDEERKIFDNFDPKKYLVKDLGGENKRTLH